ncbi:MAG: hypothetical protein PHP59_09765, partial [Methanofollis sp.]|uniref:hypothetical protein n=1 Tax=Methanofollis sp. TaxID=2052835 RepID=UPI00262EA763
MMLTSPKDRTIGTGETNMAIKPIAVASMAMSTSREPESSSSICSSKAVFPVISIRTPGGGDSLSITD